MSERERAIRFSPDGSVSPVIENAQGEWEDDPNPTAIRSEVEIDGKPWISYTFPSPKLTVGMRFRWWLIGIWYRLRAVAVRKKPANDVAFSLEFEPDFVWIKERKDSGPST